MDTPRKIEILPQLPTSATDWQSPQYPTHSPGIEKIARNRLREAVSPYLRQHAANPVDWWPWSEEAFAEAKKRDVPVFISIGYAACHWCHVMAHDVFENEDAAAFINAHFVPIKVDREENPEVDAIYMEALVAMTGHGGWPLNAWADHDGRPFHAVSTLLMRPMDYQGDFLSVARAIVDGWTHRRAFLEEHAIDVVDAIERDRSGEHELNDIEDDERVLKSLAIIESGWDPIHGGFGLGPQFPMAPHVAALLEVGHNRDEERVTRVRTMLDRMALGGLRDQFGGGFHRYCVDRHWSVPHFEKMLYDNAQLARIYLDSWRLGGPAEHGQVAAQTLDWILHEMGLDNGCFAASLDADDADGEGRFYTWTPAELAEALNGGDADLIGEVFDIDEGGNFEDGRSVPQLTHWPNQTVLNQLTPLLGQLRAHRARRPPPAMDTKQVVAWNALTISALAYAGVVLDRPNYLQHAQEAIGELQKGAHAGLMPARQPRPDEMLPPGDLATQGLFAQALADVALTGGASDLLDAAADLVVRAFEEFVNESGTTIFRSGVGRGDLCTRLHAWDDGALPGGASALLGAYHTLLSLGWEHPIQNRVKEHLIGVRKVLETRPSASPCLAALLDRRFVGRPLVVLLGQDGPEFRYMRRVTWTTARPGATLAAWPQAQPPQTKHTFLALQGKKADNGPVAWPCVGTACSEPITDAQSLHMWLSWVGTPKQPLP